jgi:hypothetical protein
MVVPAGATFLVPETPPALKFDDTTDVAFVDAQVRVVLPPGAMVDGVAVSVMVGSGQFTVTVTDAVACPPAPCTVMVYMVVFGTVTFFVPFTPEALKFDDTTDVAFVDDQVRVVAPLGATDVGAAESVTVGMIFTCTLEVSVLLPSLFRTVMV